MDNLFGDKISCLPLQGLSWKRDLIYFEGPLLSEYRNSRNETVLKFWCDCDDHFNRWMFIKIKEQDRLRLVLGEKPLRSAVLEQPEEFVFLIDEAEDESNDLFYMVLTENLPPSYIPDETAVLDIASYEEDEGLTSFVFEDEWEIDDLKDLYRKFTQVYDFLYLTLKGVGSQVRSLPWQGGFSAVHFYDKLKQAIPHADKGGLESVHYASPGYLKVRSNSEIANESLKAINIYLEEKDVIDVLYRDLAIRIRDLTLNGMPISQAIMDFSNDPECLRLYRELCKEMKGFDSDWLEDHIDSSFERCKIVMAHYRRLKAFSERIDDRSVRAISSLIDRT